MTETSLNESKNLIGAAPFQFRKYLDRTDIQQYVHELAVRMRRDFQDRNPILIGILRGSFIFLADLIREMNIPCEVDFLKLSSYGDGMTSGSIVMKKDLDCDITGRDVILIDDIVDTGNSWDYLRIHLLKKNPASLTMASMFRKPEAVQSGVPVDYVGCDLPNVFVVGYGLDHAGQWRQLPDLYILVDSGA